MSCAVMRLFSVLTVDICISCQMVDSGGDGPMVLSFMSGCGIGSIHSCRRRGRTKVDECEQLRLNEEDRQCNAACDLPK